MAATVVSRICPFTRGTILLLTRNCGSFGNRQFSAVRFLKNGKNKYLWLIGGGVVALCAYTNLFKSAEVQAANHTTLQNNEFHSAKLNSRERRFIKFASVEFDGQLYMTPRDFLDAVVEQEARPRLKRRTLTPQEVTQYCNDTPPLKKGSSKLFTNIRDKGIITYTEYIFLLSIVTKPSSGFQIAFNMFDTDGNQRVDMNEFLVIRQILGGSFREKKMDEATQAIFLNRKYHVRTTLQTHFFGPKGNQVLTFDGFHKFMDNLQTEILFIEFNGFSKGNAYITELDFAKLLLRYTYLETDEYDAFLSRLLTHITDDTGITFPEFLDFCRFLNNLSDFSIAMRMYNMADLAISKSEFIRAVKICTGYTLSEHVVDTVFALFDKDGDGRLSHEEFVDIMRDRLHRGFKSASRGEGWEAFTTCVQKELRRKNSML